MSYDIIKAFKIDLKSLTITGKYSPSNVRDRNDRRLVDDFKQEFSTRDELEKKLIVWANAILDGEAHFPKNHTFQKRVQWLIRNGYGREERDVSNWRNLADTQEIRDYLTGKNKIKFKTFGIISKYDPSKGSVYELSYNAALKVTAARIRLIPVGQYQEEMTIEEIIKASQGQRCLSKLSEQEVEQVKNRHKDFLERYHAEIVEL